MDLEYLRKELEEYFGKDFKVDIGHDDRYTLNVTITPPPFIPSLDEKGRLWYTSTLKEFPLKYTIENDKYLIETTTKIAELLEGAEIWKP